ncbi:MAG: response regulator [Spirochaetaceae bacterium]|jgi:putative two-component system response regulator|nr:response regulator [Spirochaetaceae bacterium]
MTNIRKKIVLVDDSVTNLRIGSRILIKKYDVFTVPSAAKLFQLLQKITPDLILLDIDMPVMNGHETIRILKANGQSGKIPVIFLSSNNGPSCESEGLELGAADYMLKPYSPQLLLKRIETQLRLGDQEKVIAEYEEKLRQMEREKTKVLEELQKNVLKTVIELVERRDEVTGGHVERTYQYVGVLLDVLIKNNIYQDIVRFWEKDFLLQSTRLYDLGKVSINDKILLKPGKLTDEEYAEMKTHTLLGVKIIEDIEADLQESSAETGFLEHAKAFAGCHHEWWDGTGYPYGLKGYNIPLQGRIMAIADVYAALVTERPYEKARTHEEATRIIAQGKGTHFDPTLVDMFISVADQFQNISQLGK